MTEETRKRLPGIIERIDELRDEVEMINQAEVEEHQKKHDEMDRVARLDAAHKEKQLYDVYASLDDAANILANF